MIDPGDFPGSFFSRSDRREKYYQEGLFSSNQNLLHEMHFSAALFGHAGYQLWAIG
jgi:hypothetical protein